MTVPTSQVEVRPSYRIVSSRFPPIGLFDRIARADDLEALFEIEGMTNPRLREQVGDLGLVPPGRRVAGPGTTPIMSAFTHLNRDGSRFSDGSYGIYYAAFAEETAIRETVHHRERFLSATAEAACHVQMRCYLGDVAGELHDLRGGYPEEHAPNNYGASQALAKALRSAGSNGIAYDSVRHAGGACVALFYPDLIAPVRQGAHLTYHWDGSRISAVEIAHQTMTL